RPANGHGLPARSTTPGSESGIRLWPRSSTYGRRPCLAAREMHVCPGPRLNEELTGSTQHDLAPPNVQGLGHHLHTTPTGGGQRLRRSEGNIIEKHLAGRAVEEQLRLWKFRLCRTEEADHEPRLGPDTLRQ